MRVPISTSPLAVFLLSAALVATWCCRDAAPKWRDDGGIWNTGSPNSVPRQERQLTPADFAVPGDLSYAGGFASSALGYNCYPRDVLWDPRL